MRADPCKRDASECPPASRGHFNGIIQHSFALQLALHRQPFVGRTNDARVSERFGLPGAFPVGPSPESNVTSAEQSSLAGFTTIGSLAMSHLNQAKCKNSAGLPNALKWASCSTPKVDCDEYEEPRLIFTDIFDDERRPTVADFLVKSPTSCKEATEISQTLFEVMAHKRSRLFGFALANRFVNVMLPHAIMELSCENAEDQAWFLQPLVSFIRGGRDRTRLRSTYTLTVFLIPVTVNGSTFGLRQMSTREIEQIGSPGWGFAASRPIVAVPEFAVSGPLFGYLLQLSKFDLYEMQRPPRKRTSHDGDSHERRHIVTLRQAAEKIGFGVGLSVAQGRIGRADLRTMRAIGNDVVMSLGSARVSSVVVVDDDLDACDVEKEIGDESFPGNLSPLLSSLAKPLRSPRASDPDARKFRLDRPFDDDDIYATGVIPSKRCLVVVSSGGAQCGFRESALMQAGSIGYMTLGAATAIGTLREIDKQLEHLEGAKPSKVAEIDREIAADLNEIYDLDITRESYRRMYRRLRDRLGITRDYKTLQDEMNALHRATSTVHGDKAQRMLAVLTAAIVVLSVLILIGTLVLIGKPGG